MTTKSFTSGLRPFVVVASFGLCIPAQVFAQPPPQQTAEQDATAEGSSSSTSAQAYFEQGSTLFKQQKYADAIAYFLKANRLRPSPELLFNIGLAHDKLGNTAEALRYYREYQHDAGSAAPDARVGERVSELEQRLAETGVQQVTLRSTPSGATVSIDGREVGTTPWTGELTPGVHAADLRLAGYESSQLKFTLSSRAALDLASTLRKASAQNVSAPSLVQKPAPASRVVGQHAKDEPVLEPSTGPQFGAWPWVSIGLSVASGITAGTFEVARRNAQQDAKEAETQSRFSESVTRSETHQTTARVAAGASVAFLSVGVLLLVLDATDESDDSAAFTCHSRDCHLSLHF